MKRIISFFLLSNVLTVVAQSPGGVSTNNTVWLKANAGLTVNTVNNSVTTWNEYSGANATGNFSTQGVAINKPLHVAPLVVENGINFNPYIRFNSTASQNSISSANAVIGGSFLDPNLITVFQVVNLKQGTGTGVWLKWQWSTNSYAGPRLGNEVNNPGNLGRARFDYRGANLFSATNILNKHTLMTQFVNTTERGIRIAGKQDAVAPATGTSNFGTTTGRITLGAEPYGDDYACNIDIAEVIIYKGALTAIELAKVESYLAVKYGVTLEQVGAYANNYINSSGTIIWSNSNNSGFSNNITGIGRDDGSALLQKQSRSINTSPGLVTIYAGTSSGTFPITNTANSTPIVNNNDFILFGDNGAGLLLTECVNNGRGVALARKWKVQTLGNLGASTLTISKSEFPTNITSLYIADDPNFNSNVEVISLRDNGTELYATFNPSGSSYKYFTFGTSSVELNAINDTICNGSLGNIITNPVGGLAPLTFSWNSVPVQTTSSLMAVPGGAYTVSVSHNGGLCSFIESASVFQSPSSMEISIAELENAMCTSATGSLMAIGYFGVTPYQYKVDNEPYSFDNTIRGLTAGMHRITIKDAYNCTIDTMVLVGKDTPDIKTTVETVDAWCDLGGLGGYAKIFVSNAAPPLSYDWNNTGAGTINTQNNLAKGLYKVVINDYYGCTALVNFKLEETPCCEIAFPNAFTPNNDGLNDKFGVIATTELTHYNLRIYNRWGQAVFVSGNYDVGWDGTHYSTNSPCDNGVYYYALEYRCPVQQTTLFKKGEITLLR